MNAVQQQTVFVTGASSGFGAAIARRFAADGALVIVAARRSEPLEALALDFGPSILTLTLDVRDRAVVEQAIAALPAAFSEVDVLVNNAGIMAVPQARTTDGFESQLGTNFLGHFALTGLLLPRVTDRVVTLSSGAHRMGRINLEDPNWENRRYRRWSAYGQSKLADLMFAYELQRRLLLAGSSVRSIAAHPGYAATNLQASMGRAAVAVQGVLLRVGVVQDAAGGAEPTLYAATAPDLPGGSFVGPSGPGEMSGPAQIVGSSSASRDLDVQRGLWDLAVRLTGVDPGLPADVVA